LVASAEAAEYADTSRTQLDWGRPPVVNLAVGARASITTHIQPVQDLERRRGICGRLRYPDATEHTGKTNRGQAVNELQEFRGLLAGLREGDPTAATELCRRYEPFIRAAVRRQLHHRLRTLFDSLDFVQDVWASFLAAPPDRYTFDSPQALLGFLRRVAHNKVVEVFRRRFETQKADATREVSVGDPADGGDPPSPSPTPSQWVIAEERWEQLLGHFAVGHRVILERLREGHNNEDIARMANVSLSTVNRVVRRLKDLTRL